ncbi:GNAT family N-acetyltransferase [Alkaliphilus hydrothermalis]|uniref:RimJ/RimL family protein N-acetyltransferase n=1 Tax=Alkaliphilus hydrothermalis TaxID=1482730 RepID=A0ABS2NPQ1_9FIRM|nr:RimJ/RimL family protein N-acetyltransferase [Alkaliphilus hydrothermalis]
MYYDKLSHSSADSIRNTGTKIIITKAGLRGYLSSISNNSSRLDCFIVSKENDEIVGEVVINSIDWQNRSASTRIAIYQEKDYNKKYGTEGLQIALSYAFGMYNLHRIELQVYSFNERAIHVYEKIGFKKEGVLRDALYFENKYHDAIVMSILVKEFKK